MHGAWHLHLMLPKSLTQKNFRASRCTTCPFECRPNHMLCYMIVTCQEEQISSKPLLYNRARTRNASFIVSEVASGLGQDSICGRSDEPQCRNTIHNAPFFERHDDGSSLGLGSSGWKFQNTE